MDGFSEGEKLSKRMDKLRQFFELIRVKMQGLWVGLILSLLLLVYGLSSLPGHVMVAVIAFLPLVIAWRARVIKTVRAEHERLHHANNTLRSEKAELQSTRARLEVENTELKRKSATLEKEKEDLERERATSHKRLTELLALISDGVLITDAEGKVVYVNSGFEQLSNKSARDVTGRSYDTLIKNESLVQGIAQAIATNTIQTVQVSSLGLYGPVSAASIRSVWTQNKPDGAVIVLHKDDLLDYKNRNSPLPRSRSTVSLGDVFSWFFPSDSFQPAEPYINQVAHKSRNDPKYAGRYGLAGSAEPETGSTLYSLVRLMRPKNVIEIGSYIGTSSICIAQALVDNGDSGMLNCIEAENNHIALAIDHLREASLEHKVIFHYGCSHDPSIIHALPSSEIIFVDGDHSYEGAKKDFDIYSKLLTDDGIIVYHDTIKIMALQRLITEIAQNPYYDVFTFATSDGDGVTLIRKGLDK
jgi:predicted O-methyltransferase YrrM/PAS domain-containing protein